MKTKNKLYQETLNNKVQQLLKKTVQELKKLDDYGQESITFKNRKIEIGWWKYKLNDQTTHIVYKTFRKTFLFLQRPYLQGIKIIDDKIEYLNDKELGDYD
jgi:hypothetical protein